MPKPKKGDIVRVRKCTSALYEYIGDVVSYKGNTLCLKIPFLGTQKIYNIIPEEIEFPLKHRDRHK